jgi:CBS domain containing-hemolysin-like protein
VVDEHGGTSGIVTIADVVAELVGNVAELGRKVEEVKLLPGGRFELPGTAQLEDLRERLDVEFDVKDDEVSTIAGYLMVRLGRVPEKGDRVAVGHYEVRVEEVDGPRVSRVRVEPKLPKVPPTPQTPGAAGGPKA